MSKTPEFYVTDNFFSNGGAVVAGPFSTHADAIVARTGIERVAKTAAYYVDELTTPPVDLPTEPTTAVPTKALDELRERSGRVSCSMSRAFLAAVDKAAKS